MRKNRNINNKTSALALGSAFTALSVVFLYIAGVLPVMRIAFPAVAGLLCAAMLLSYGVGFSLLLYIAACVISLLLLPVKTPALLYAAFFGYYPILKYFIEKLRNLPVEWILKLLLFNFIFTFLFYLSSDTVGLKGIFSAFPAFLLYPAADIGFILYDIVFSLLAAKFRSRLYR